MKISIQRLVWKALIVAACFHLFACGGSGGGDDVFRYDPGIPNQIVGLEVMEGFERVTLSWDTSDDRVSMWFVVYYYSAEDPDNVTTLTVDHSPPVLIKGLENDTTYYFSVAGVNLNGEGKSSTVAPGTPRPFTNQDLEGEWYFHSLVTGSDAKWERGTMTFTLVPGLETEATAVVTDFEDSSSSGDSPGGFTISIDEVGELAVVVSSPDEWADFHGNMGSGKTMMAATYSYAADSQALIILQKKRDANDYTVDDIGGSGGAVYGPTRFVYHQLYSGANTEWEYGNARVGQNGVSWWRETEEPTREDPELEYKGVSYWDFSTPKYKSENYQFFAKATSFDMDSSGLLTEYWCQEWALDDLDAYPHTPPYSYNVLYPTTPHQAVFTGRMTYDKTMVIGVHTREVGGEKQYFMRIMQLCFVPTGSASPPAPDLSDLAGSYRFHKLSANTPESASPGEASWAHGEIDVAADGTTTFDDYADSFANGIYPATAEYPNTFVFSYYPDPEPRNRPYRDFPNYVTPVEEESPNSYYYVGADPIHTYWDFSSNQVAPWDGTTWVPAPVDPTLWTWREIDISANYYNEHVSMSFLRDVLVMTRTDPLGYSLMIGLE